MSDASATLQDPWALVTLRVGTSTRVGILPVAGGPVRLPAELAGCAGVMDVVRQWGTMEPALRRLTTQDGEPVEDAELLTPLRFPPKVLCSGPNYHDHLAEMGQSGLGDAWTAYFFFKPPTTTLIGPTGPRTPSSSDPAGRQTASTGRASSPW